MEQRTIRQCKNCEHFRRNDLWQFRCLEISFLHPNELIRPDFGCWSWKEATVTNLGSGVSMFASTVSG